MASCIEKHVNPGRMAVWLVSITLSLQAQGVITTIAGTDFSFPAGPLPAASAPTGEVRSVMADAQGNVFFSDSQNCLVLKVDLQGILNVVAGNGICGLSGDGGPAISASISVVTGLAVDNAGNLYLSDSRNNRIRRVSPSGTIDTFAGRGLCQSSLDGVPALSTDLCGPGHLSIAPSGDLFVSTFTVIRKITPSGIVQRAWSGNLTPRGIVVDTSGNLYFSASDAFTNQVARLSSDGVTTVVAGGARSGYAGDGGPAAQASLYLPDGLALDSAGNLFIADYGNNRIRKVTPSGLISTVAGDGLAGFAGDGTTGPGSLYFPNAVAVDAGGNLFISDQHNRRIRKVARNGLLTTYAGSGRFQYAGDGGPAITGVLSPPTSVAVDSIGTVYVADAFNNRVRAISPSGILTTVAGSGNAGYSGDGSSADTANLNYPVSVAIDKSGSLLIADSLNNRIRAVSSAGIITTVAGNGVGAFSGDGGPAAKASIYFPEGVSADAAGTVYIADAPNQIIRKVAPSGTISTVAGNRGNSFSGDGGPATAAALAYPWHAIADSAGNLYIADYGNHRIRKVTSDGLIYTIAGNGKAAFSGDGGPAAAASLKNPEGLALDAAGNLYVADQGNNRIRRITPAGVISTVAGGGSGGDGALATDAGLGAPGGVAVDRSGNLYIADTNASRVRKVLAAPVVFNDPAPGGIRLSGRSGGKTVVAQLALSGAVPGAPQQPVTGLAYSVSVASADWLSVSPDSGRTPGLLTIRGDPLDLLPGTYRADISISFPLANPPTRIVPVEFVVGDAVAATLAVDRSRLSFTYSTASAARTQSVTVSNLGSGGITFSATLSFDSASASDWLQLTSSSSTALPSSPVVLILRAEPSGLPPGTYSARLTIAGTNSAASPIVIPIAMTITSNTRILLLSKTGFTFTAVQSGGVIPSQSFGVLNLGSGSLNWTAQVSTLSGGAWLLASPLAGTSNASGSEEPPQVTVSVNTTGLAPGTHYGLVKVLCAGAANSPQEVVIVLRVLPAGTDDERTAPIVRPSALVFTRTAGQSSPGSQELLVYDPTGTSKSFRSARSTTFGGDWLLSVPADATISPAKPARIVVQPSITGLASGTYTATVTLQFSDGRVKVATIAFIIASATSRVASRPIASARPADGSDGPCTPTRLLPALTSLGSGFNVPAGYPHGLEARVVDDCGNTHLTGNVYVEFSNGDPPVRLSSLNNGRWDGTWKTGTLQAAQVTLTVTATNPDLRIRGESQTTGGLGTPQPAPVVADNGVVSAASLQPSPLAPGALISVFGDGLSEGTLQAPGLPLPQQLGGTTISIGDHILPLLYTSDGQVNAVVPLDLNVNTNQQLLVQRGTTYAAAPVYVDVASAQPAVFQASGQAIVTDRHGQLINPTNPLRPGDVAIIYCAGLGQVQPSVADGAAATGLTHTTNPVAVKLADKPAEVLFAGLTPGFVGLYQVNAVVPETVTDGEVPLVLTVAAQHSDPVMLSVRK